MDGGQGEEYNPARVARPGSNSGPGPTDVSSDISYHEYRTIAQLLQAHAAEHGHRLRAMVAFGELVTTDSSVDIDLLEIVEGWEGKRLWPFSSTPELPLRGQLRLHFLTPEEFENPGLVQEPDEQAWVRELLERVHHGYEIVMDRSPGWVQRVLGGSERVSAATAPPSGVGRSGSPLALTHGG